MNFFRGAFGVGETGEDNGEVGGAGGSNVGVGGATGNVDGRGGAVENGARKQESKVRDHATFFSWKNIWTDTATEGAEGDKVRARGSAGGNRDRRRSRSGSIGLSVIDEGRNDCEDKEDSVMSRSSQGVVGSGKRRCSRDSVGRVGTESASGQRQDKEDIGTVPSPETSRRGSIADGIKRVVTANNTVISDGKSDGSGQTGYFSLPWKDKPVSFPWKKDNEQKGKDGDKSPLLPEGGSSENISTRNRGGDDGTKISSKAKSPSRHFPWQSADSGKAESTSELSFSLPWKLSSDTSKKESGNLESSLNFPWFGTNSKSGDEKEGKEASDVAQPGAEVDSTMTDDRNSSLTTEIPAERSKPKEKEKQNPFQNVPWLVSLGSEKSDKEKETRNLWSGFSLNREGGTEKKKSERDSWSAAVQLLLRKTEEDKGKEEASVPVEEVVDLQKEKSDLETIDLKSDEQDAMAYAEPDTELSGPSVRRFVKTDGESSLPKLDSLRSALKLGKSDDDRGKETATKDECFDANGSSHQGPSPYLDQFVGFKTRAGRFKDKILQNLGKADKTTDDVFDEFEGNFSKQQQNANRLHKEVANYLRCCRALHGASKGLFETLAEVYEPEWVGHELLYAQAQNSDMLWTDFCHKVQDQTLAPLTAYVSQFPDIRKKIDKRGRKLVDYDSQRHQLENLQRATRRDEYKIARAQDTLETARVTYEALNKELYEELPGLYDQRIPNVSNHVQSLFAAEATFMAESSKVAKELEAISDKLSKECAKGTYRTKQKASPRPLSVVDMNKAKNPNSPSMWYDGGAGDEGENSYRTEGNEGVLEISAMENSSAPTELEQSYRSVPDNDRTPTPPSSPYPLECLTNNDADSALNPTTPPHHSQPDEDKRPTISGPMKKEEIGRPYEEIEFEDKKVNGTLSARSNGEVIGTKIPAGLGVSGQEGQKESVESLEVRNASSNPDLVHPPLAGQDPGTVAPSVSPAADSGLSNGPSFTSPLADLNKKVEEIYDIPVDGGIQNGTLTGATTEGLPQGVLYRVRATYKYTREDVDEISFEVGDIIQVVEYEDPEEQEEGWLCGVKEGTSEKGLFPANFTRPL